MKKFFQSSWLYAAFAAWAFVSIHCYYANDFDKVDQQDLQNIASRQKIERDYQKSQKPKPVADYKIQTPNND